MPGSVSDWILLFHIHTKIEIDTLIMPPAHMASCGQQQHMRTPKHMLGSEAVPSLRSPLPQQILKCEMRVSTCARAHTLTHTQRKHNETYMAIDDQAITVCQVSRVDARELGRGIQFILDGGRVYMYAGLPSNCLVLVPLQISALQSI